VIDASFRYNENRKLFSNPFICNLYSQHDTFFFMSYLQKSFIIYSIG